MDQNKIICLKHFTFRGGVVACLFVCCWCCFGGFGVVLGGG